MYRSSSPAPPAQSGGRKPLALPAIREWMRTEFRTFHRPSLEGDDVMGILATSDKIIRGEKVIVSIDKDMKTIPGLVFNPSRDNEPRGVSVGEANYWHLFQALTGDQVDGYAGGAPHWAEEGRASSYCQKLVTQVSGGAFG